jgi:hypothetical protein
LNGIQFDQSFVLASLDVVSLFTNVPITSASESIKKRWSDINKKTSIPHDEFLIAVNLVLNPTLFTFENVKYKQIFGTPMGSPLSPIIADIVMQDIETVALKCIPSPPLFYYRYVDDILLAIKKDLVDNVVEVFNSLHDRLKFTLEVSDNNSINFLDVSIIIDNNRITFDLYHKPTYSGRYLNFYSNHPPIHKKGVIYGLTDRIVSLSHPKYFQKNFEKMIQILLDNYPLDFIFSSINNRLKKLFNKFDKTEDDSNNNKNSFFTIPYMEEVSNGFTQITKDMNLK